VVVEDRDTLVIGALIVKPPLGTMPVVPKLNEFKRPKVASSVLVVRLMLATRFWATVVAT
jgi:hypothetical protein